MAALTADQKALLATPVFAWATVVRPDGSLHSTVVWIDLDGDDIVFNTAVGRTKEKYLRANPQLAISALDPQDPYQFVSVSGTAGFSDEDGDARIDALAKKYLGVDSYPNRREGEVRVTIRLSPDKILGQ
jgi:PPOX class probable F420-dependent enzyme